jgi:AcrR family transcriptional regulator
MKRTLEKRQAILDAAGAVFRDKGYERASMLAAGAGHARVDLPCRDLGAARIDAALAGYLRAQMDAGILRRGDAHGSARQFRALLDASWFDRVLFDCGAGPAPGLGPGQVEQELQFALAAFLRACEPAPEPTRATRTLTPTNPA